MESNPFRVAFHRWKLFILEVYVALSPRSFGRALEDFRLPFFAHNTLLNILKYALSRIIPQPDSGSDGLLRFVITPEAG